MKDFFLTETLRMYPPITFLDRKCTNRDGYSLKPYDDFIVPYRMPIIIPIYAIHRDPKVNRFYCFMIIEMKNVHLISTVLV